MPVGSTAFVLLTAAIACQLTNAADWAYTGPTGPYYWQENVNYRQCGGSSQSPINIKAGALIAFSPRPIWFNYDLTPLKMTMANNGHTLSLTAEYTGGRQLPQLLIKSDAYQLASVHFHWGRDDYEGSEHAFQQRKYPLEMHCVHRRVVNGVIQPEIAVIAILFDLSAQRNAGLERFIQNAPQIRKAETEFEIIPAFPWSALIPEFSSNFYTYKGSLTTPPCSEVVTWFVRQELAKVSHAQLELFRLLRNDERENMSSNFRPLQLRWGRIVSYVKA